MTRPSTDFRWSFSQWESYNSCPARWKFKNVLKLPGLPPGPAAARGLFIHKSVEDYISKRTDGLHEAIHPKYSIVFDAFKDHPNGETHCELKLGFDENWERTEGIRGDKTWCVMVLDAVRVGGAWYGPDKGNGSATAFIGEWKSGKPKETHPEQRKLYALGAFLRWPGLAQVQATTYYLEDTESPQRLVVNESAVDKLKALWKGRVDQMRSDVFCAPKPGMHCNWCDYAKKKGGPCAFGY